LTGVSGWHGASKKQAFRRFMEKILMISSVLESEREKMSAKIDLIQKIEKSIYGRIRKERKYERT
ncbi:hypothetical protein, partial [Hungatella sp.]|uniref:hypothetical protein n=1 Tax=Hungatella sp. TaxID=2613924 RepID=UPI002A80BDDB